MRALLYRAHLRQRRGGGALGARALSALFAPLAPRGRAPERGAPPLLTIESLNWGGGGKTALVLALARALHMRGVALSVLAHSYRGAGGSRPQLLRSPDPSFGDEAALLRERLPATVPLWVGGSWEARLSAAHRVSPAALFLSDGGGWCPRLPRRWSLFTFDLSAAVALSPAGAFKQLPEGLAPGALLWGHRLNEPLLAPQYTAARQALLEHPQLIGCSQVRAVSLRLPSGEERPPGWLRGRALFALCGLGAPSSFMGLLNALGGAVVERLFLPDHCPLPSWTELSQRLQGRALLPVITEKDAARSPQLRGRVAVLKTELRGHRGSLERLTERLIAEHPIAEHPIAEHPVTERPNAERPNAECPNAERSLGALSR